MTRGLAGCSSPTSVARVIHASLTNTAGAPLRSGALRGPLMLPLSRPFLVDFPGGLLILHRPPPLRWPRLAIRALVAVRLLESHEASVDSVQHEATDCIPVSLAVDCLGSCALQTKPQSRKPYRVGFHMKALAVS